MLSCSTKDERTGEEILRRIITILLTLNSQNFNF